MGYFQDTIDHRDKPVGEMLRATASSGKRLAQPNMLPYRKKRILQGHVGSCCAFAIARSIHVNMLLQEPANSTAPDPEIPSPWFIYYNGRAQEYKSMPPEIRPPVIDNGTYPRLGMTSVQNVGFAPWSAAPYDERLVNSRPSRSSYDLAYDQRGLTYARIYEKGTAFVDAAANAIMAGASVFICGNVDKPFMSNRGELISKIDSAQIVGGHAIWLAAISDGEARIDNWWDEWGVPTNDWNTDGIGRVSLDLLGSSWITDAYAVQYAPNYSVGA